MNEFDLTNEQIEEAKKLGLAGATEPYLGILDNGIKYFEPFLEDKINWSFCKCRTQPQH